MDNESPKPAQTDTGGGAYIGKDVNAGGDVAGRDINVTNVHNYYDLQPDISSKSSKNFVLLVIIIIGIAIVGIMVVAYINNFIISRGSGEPTGGISKVKDTWIGTTEKGQTISFQTTSNDFMGPYLLNLIVSIQFDPPCPLGQVTFNKPEFTLINRDLEGAFSLTTLRKGDLNADIYVRIISDSSGFATVSVIDNKNTEDNEEINCTFPIDLELKLIRQ